MRKIRFVGLLVAVCTPLSINVFADTGATFLTIGGAARPVVVGEAYTAATGDVEALPYNPAGIVGLPRAALSVTHTEWLQDTNYDVLQFAVPTRVGEWGVSALRLGAGTFEGRDEFRNKLGHFTAEDYAVGLTYGHRIGSYLGLAGTAQFLNSRIASEDARGIAFDVGSTFRCPGLPLWLGAAVLHLGQGLKFINERDVLPLTLALGARYQPAARVLISLDLKNEPRADRSHVDAGLELLPLTYLALRLGYTAQVGGGVLDAMGGIDSLRGGIGLRWSHYHADYTLAPFGELGLTHRFTISTTFGPTPAAATSDDQLLLFMPEP